MLQIRDLYKQYGKFRALNGLNLNIGHGELFGFVGPNGAGKTTTMRIIAGLLSYDAGSVSIDGVEIRDNLWAVKEKVGYMPDFFGVYDNLKVIEYMEFFASLYGIEGKKAQRLNMELLEMVNLKEKADAYVDALSRGMKQKLCLARSLVNRPELLILDEPASGLDPRARCEMKEILKQLVSEGVTILISSHILPELAQMCTRIGIINQGVLAAAGTVEEITHTITTSNPLVIRVLEQQEEAIRILKENPHTRNISIKGNDLFLGFDGEEAEQGEMLTRLIAGGVVISSYNREEGDLETLFMKLTKEEEVQG